MVGGWPGRGWRRRRIYVDHGAGQTYPGGHPSYPGGRWHDPHGLFLAPREEVAEQWRVAYPEATVVTIGSPLLDRLLALRLARRNPVWSVHWPCRVASEAGWAWPEWRRNITPPAMVHPHPRALEAVRATSPVQVIPDLGDALRWASVWIADNTTSAFLAMALGIPVVWVTVPRWRHASAPPRFSWGRDGVPEVGHPADLPAAVDAALSGAHDAASRAIAERCWTHLDQNASTRAANAIATWLTTL